MSGPSTGSGEEGYDACASAQTPRDPTGNARRDEREHRTAPVFGREDGAALRRIFRLGLIGRIYFDQ